MINSLTVSEAKLHKRHNILLFHYVRSMISRGYINLQHLASEWNFADILTKNWSYQSSYHKLIQLVFIILETQQLFFLDNTLELDVSITEGSIFGILGSEKRSAQSKPEARVCGKLNTIKEVEQISLQVKYDVTISSLRCEDMCKRNVLRRNK